MPSIFEAKRDDYRSATQRVYHSPSYPTHLEVVVNSPAPKG